MKVKLLLLVGALLSSRTQSCPRPCHCSHRNGLVVQCTSQDLEEVPQDLPPDTVVLLLSSNRIRHIPREALEGLRRLRTLDLSHNALQSLEPGAFLDSRGTLKTLDLSHNQLSTLPSDTFSSLTSRVRLSNNPWHCGCGLQEALRELLLDPDTVQEVRCSTSERQEDVGRPVIQVLDSGFNFCTYHRRTTDGVLLGAMFLWFSMVAAYLVHYTRTNREEACRHAGDLHSLPGTTHCSSPSSAHCSQDSHTASSLS